MSKNKPKPPPKPLSEKQADLVKHLYEKEMAVTFGPAGTGKTFIPAAYAAYFYSLNKIDKIILTRPNIPVGKSIGYFPGTLLEKMAPWTQPIVNVLSTYLSKGEVECMLKNEKLQIIPFEVIRGHTFDNAFVILDEAQNTTVAEIKAFVTRIGQHSKVVINGDISQSDLKDTSDCGLAYILDLLSDDYNRELYNRVGVVEFDVEDVVRSELCKLWLKAMR